MKKLDFARLGFLAPILLLASCAGRQAGGKHQVEGKFNNPPEFFRAAANSLSLFAEAAGILTIFIGADIHGRWPWQAARISSNILGGNVDDG